DRVGERVGGIETSAVRGDAHEIGVAEAADRAIAIGLVPRPEIAARKSAEHRRAPRVGAFALQREEDFLDGVHAARSGQAYAVGSEMPASANPFRRSWHASQRPQARPS